MSNFIEELKWRGLYYDATPEAANVINTPQKGYIGFDPTANSLTIGNLVQIIVLKHFQNYGHQPIALVGGATGMIGDPSGKKSERSFLSNEELQHNLQSLKKQISKFLDFDKEANPALMVNNYDWFNSMSVLEFLRDAGKHLTVSYMLAKDSVQSRMESGISFTEFSYQLIQGWDFYHLFTNYNCAIQLGGQDQWGNMTAGIELIRRKAQKEAHVITVPLVNKSDGTKFSKSEGGAIWLDPTMTSPYQFYQFWLNQADDDAEKFIKVFTFLDKITIDKLITEHNVEPHKRILQQRLAKEVTTWVHSEADCIKAEQTSQILFSNSSAEALHSLTKEEIADVFNGVPLFEVQKNMVENGVDILNLLTHHTSIYNSKGEARKAIQAGALSINREKINDISAVITKEQSIDNTYWVFQKGKKNYVLVQLV